MSATRPGTSRSMASWVGTTAISAPPAGEVKAADAGPGPRTASPRWCVPAAETTWKMPGTRESSAA